MLLQENAVFKLSYGMFYLGCESNGTSNVCVVNTVAQVTQEPLKLSVTVLKTNHTQYLIKESNKFSVGVMNVNVNLDTINHFGTQSGRNIDKLANFPHKIDELGNPLIDEGCSAVYCCIVTKVIDLGTHTMFIADLVGAETLSNDEVLTYAGYRSLKTSGVKPANNTIAPASPQWQCNVCHYIYDGEKNFSDLPDDYLCPVCGKSKDVFKLV